jgi:hypothetical protein
MQNTDKILINGVEQTYDLSSYPPKYRAHEVFLDLAEKNPGRDIQLIMNGKLVGWRND